MASWSTFIFKSLILNSEGKGKKDNKRKGGGGGGGGGGIHFQPFMLPPKHKYMDAQPTCKLCHTFATVFGR